MKILLVDDDELIRGSLEMVFRNKGFYMVAVESGEAGLSSLEQERFDVLISDYRLPGINGIEFLKTAGKTNPDTINIMITAYGDDTILTEAKEAGVHDFIPKPFSPRDLIGSITRLMGP